MKAEAHKIIYKYGKGPDYGPGTQLGTTSSTTETILYCNLEILPHI
jgi:hypothetical protein